MDVIIVPNAQGTVENVIIVSHASGTVMVVIIVPNAQGIVENVMIVSHAPGTVMVVIIVPNAPGTVIIKLMVIVTFMIMMFPSKIMMMRIIEVPVVLIVPNANQAVKVAKITQRAKLPAILALNK